MWNIPFDFLATSPYLWYWGVQYFPQNLLKAKKYENKLWNLTGLHQFFLLDQYFINFALHQKYYFEDLHNRKLGFPVTENFLKLKQLNTDKWWIPIFLVMSILWN